MCFLRRNYFAYSAFNYDDRAIEDYLSVGHMNGIPALAARYPMGNVVKTDYFLTRAEYERLDIYNHFFRERDQLNASRGLWAYRDKTNAAFLAVDIPERFSEQERATLDDSLATILPHLQRAFSLMLELDLQRSRDAQARMWLETLPSTALILGSDLVVSARNQASDVLLSGNCGMSIGSGARLQFASDEQRDAIVPTLRRSLTTLDPQGPFSVPSPPGSLLSAYCIPLPVGPHRDEVLRFFHTARREALLVLVDALDLPSMPAESLSVGLGITFAEARIVAELCSGGDLRAAADSLGISYNTARVQMTSASGKLGLRRQTELVAAAATLLSVFARLPK